MTERQEKLLKMIVEEYITSGEPVGSVFLADKYHLDFSSATIRHEMSILENLSLLEKSHTSSGRVPSVQGFKHYAEFLANDENQLLAKKLDDIFARRRAAIDFTIDDAANAIADIAGLTLSITSCDTEELMKSIQLTPINDRMATIVIVTSTGRVESKLLEFGKHVQIEDVRIAVRIFKERLVDTRLRDLSIKAEALASILANTIKNYEEVIKAFVSKVFDFHNKVKNKVFGNSNIIKSDIKREDLAVLLDLVEHKSVWQTIENTIDEDDKLKIDIRPDNITLISKKIDGPDGEKEISVIGSHRIGYSEAKQAIRMLEKFLNKNNKE